MSRHKKIIVSPSGNLYGSENVLYEYLCNTKLLFDQIYVPKNSIFFKKLESLEIKKKTFVFVKCLYLRIFCQLIFDDVKIVYLNEAGHVKYVQLLALFFRNVKFVVHIRLLEDTYRVKKQNSNITYVAISKFIQSSTHVFSHLIYDGYSFKNLIDWNIRNVSRPRVGIVGRVAKSKGFYFFNEQFIQQNGKNMEFHFFGEVDKDVKGEGSFETIKKLNNVFFHGFIPEQEKIYADLNILLHVNALEPLGRIFFESLDYGIPLFGTKSGGIGEIAELIDYPFVYNIDDLSAGIYEYFNLTLGSFNSRLDLSRKKALEIFSVTLYANKLDNLLM